jgi:hypothetical protein
VQRGARHRLIGTVLLVGAAATVLGLGLLLRHRGLDWADKFGSAASLVIAVIALIQPLLATAVGWLRAESAFSGISMAQAKAELVAALGRKWSDENRWRRTYDPRALPVRWESADGRLDGVYEDIAY